MSIVQLSQVVDEKGQGKIIKTCIERQLVTEVEKNVWPLLEKGWAQIYYL